MLITLPFNSFLFSFLPLFNSFTLKKKRSQKKDVSLGLLWDFLFLFLFLFVFSYNLSLSIYLPFSIRYIYFNFIYILDVGVCINNLQFYKISNVKWINLIILSFLFFFFYMLLLRLLNRLKLSFFFVFLSFAVYIPCYTYINFT